MKFKLKTKKKNDCNKKSLKAHFLLIFPKTLPFFLLYFPFFLIKPKVLSVKFFLLLFKKKCNDENESEPIIIQDSNFPRIFTIGYGVLCLCFYILYIVVCCGIVKTGEKASK